MKKQNAENLKDLLLERRKEIVGSAQDEKKRDLDLEGRAKDTGDEALEMSMERLESTIRSTVIDELRLIDLALERVELGTYGVCIDCQGKISENRLEWFPYAARCIVCQEKFES